MPSRRSRTRASGATRPVKRIIAAIDWRASSEYSGTMPTRNSSMNSSPPRRMAAPTNTTAGSIATMITSAGAIL